MAIVDKLASSLGRRDEAPNQELAATIVRNKDKKAITELVDLMSSAGESIQGDSIKVLYEVAEKAPLLVSAHSSFFLRLLDHKSNRVVWGAMTALDAMTSLDPHGIHPHLGKILKVANAGSVITKDHTVGILIQLAAVKKYHAEAMALLKDAIKTCAPNQLGMYAERTLPVISENYKKEFSTLLSKRIRDLEKPSQVKRIEKILKKLNA
jgi:hypothetical protein